MGNLNERWKRGLGGKEGKYEGSRADRLKEIAEGAMLIHTLKPETRPSLSRYWMGKCEL